MTRNILRSSSISSALFCNRPAVSMRTGVRASAAALLHGVIGQPCRVRAMGPGEKLRACAIRPDLQLLHGSGPERVPRGRDDVRALARHLHRQLAQRGRLAGAIDADEKQHLRGRTGNIERGLKGLHRLGNHIGQRLPDLGIGHVLVETVPGEPVNDFSRRRRAEVCRDQ